MLFDAIGVGNGDIVVRVSYKLVVVDYAYCVLIGVYEESGLRWRRIRAAMFVVLLEHSW